MLFSFHIESDTFYVRARREGVEVLPSPNGIPTYYHLLNLQYLLPFYDLPHSISFFGRTSPLSLASFGLLLSFSPSVLTSFVPLFLEPFGLF